MGHEEHIGKLIRTPYFEIMNSLYKKLQEEDYEGANIIYSAIFQFIGDGQKLTELARLTNSSKQHVKFLLGNLEKMLYVQKRKDEQDGRAVIYSLTRKGEERRKRSVEIVRSIEAEWSDKIGEENISKLKSILREIDEMIKT